MALTFANMGCTYLRGTWRLHERPRRCPAWPGGTGRAFTALGDRLARRGVVADVFVVGGAAMALAYDGVSSVPHGIVLEEARAVADDLGLPPWWLNEQATVYISGKDDPGKRRVFDHPGCVSWQHHPSTFLP